MLYFRGVRSNPALRPGSVLRGARLHLVKLALDRFLDLLSFVCYGLPQTAGLHAGKGFVDSVCVCVGGGEGRGGGEGEGLLECRPAVLITQQLV